MCIEAKKSRKMGRRADLIASGEGFIRQASLYERHQTTPVFFFFVLFLCPALRLIRFDVFVR